MITHDEARRDTDVIIQNLPDKLEPKLLDARRIRRLRAYITQQEKKDTLLKMYKKMIFGNLSLMERMKLREKIAVLEKELYPGGFNYYG